MTKWYWCDKNTCNILSDENTKIIEQEYQQELTGKRVSQHVYHCFGDGQSALVDFTTMTTYCGSGRCIKDFDHMEYALKRIV